MMAEAAVPLKVLYLTPPSPGGTSLAAQSFVEEEIQGIRQFGVTPYVLTDAVRAPTPIAGVTLTGVPRRSTGTALATAAAALRHVRPLATVLRSASAWREVAHALRIEDAAADLIRREGIDVVHSHFGWPAGFGGSLAARTAGIPLVASIRGMDVLVRPEIGYGLRLEPGYDAALRHLFRSAARILTASSFMQRATRALGADAARVRVLEKGVDTERFRPHADRRPFKHALGLSGPVLLAVGGLIRRKGFDTIIEALAGLGQRDVTLVICGEGPERAALERRAGSLGIAGQVRFAGHIPRDRIAGYFAAADLFVHAAELEAAGNVVLEALAAGCGVVVTDSGGPSEYVQNGVTGFVVPIRDAGALAARIEALLYGAPLREQFGRAARLRVEAFHSYPRMMAGLRGIYDEVLAIGAGAEAAARESADELAFGRHDDATAR